MNYHKHRIEGRLYTPSRLLHMTTMLRARVGLLGEYGWLDQEHAPAYQRFRLGGGSTVDPLRGYDDYMVVPDKYDQIVTERYNPVAVKDSLGNVIGIHYQFRPALVRYPGGSYASTYTVEEQFPIVNPLHAVLFFDAGNTWDLPKEIQPFKLNTSLGIGFRIEIPILGNIGFDYGYGFDRTEMSIDRDGVGHIVHRPRFVGHFLLGNINN